MRLEVGRGGPVLGVLVTTNTFTCTFPFALLSGALEEVKLLALLVFDGDLCLEKTVDRRTPSGLEAF